MRTKVYSFNEELSANGYEVLKGKRLRAFIDAANNSGTHLFYCTCEFHCFADGNKRLAITLSAQFLLFNGYMAVAKNFFAITENIGAHSSKSTPRLRSAFAASR